MECFVKLASGINFDWDPVENLEFFPVMDSADTVYSRSSLSVYDKLGPCWQHFSKGNLYFFRNLYLYQQYFCAEVIEKIKEIQANCRNINSPIIKDFIGYDITPDKLTVLKTPVGMRVPKHVDARKYAVNIGLKQCDTAKTIFYPEDDVKLSFIMADGDMYLLNTSTNHSVEPLVQPENKEFRYLLTYSCE